MKDDNKKQIRVRFAPSPTGELHIGGLRTALTNFLFARNKGGVMILRVEDTDRKRLVEGAAGRMIKWLKWAGVEIDEGVILDDNGNVTQKGDFGPYIQSERLEIYDQYVQKLLNEGKAYRCFCTAERLEEMRKEQTAQGEAPAYDRCCANLSQSEVDEKVKNGEPFVIRFKVPEGRTAFTDLVYGKINVDNKTLDDFVIIKSDKFPTYHFAVVVDDYSMEISHVFRGMEWIPSAPKHVLLYEAFGWKDVMPEFCHMPNILNKSKKKLSKREGSVSVEDFQKEGYSPEAIVNFIALLGWNPKTEQEIFTMQELIEQFSTEKMHRAGGVFDIDRLNWISAQHIKRMPEERFYDLALPFFKEKEFVKNAPEARKNDEFLKKILHIEKDRLSKFTQAGEENQFFFNDNVVVSADDMRWKTASDEDTRENLLKAQKTLLEIEEKDWDLKNIEKILLDVAGDKRGDLLFPLRAALTGQKRSPSPFEVAWVLGKETTLQRISKALEILG